jgi:adenosylcobyric acid synthase
MARPPHGNRSLQVAVIRLPYTVTTTAHETHRGQVPATLDPGAWPFLDGCCCGAVSETTWHGALESDEFPRGFRAADRDFVPVDVAVRLDAFGDLVADHLDAAPLRRLIAEGPIPALPFVLPGVPA